MKLLKILNKKIITEVSEKVKNMLLSKFKKETKDDDETIIKYIDLFDKYKEGFELTKRDITNYSYSDLKSVINSKLKTKEFNDLFKNFKKKDRTIEDIVLRRYIKKFLEIKSFLPDKLQKVDNKDYLKFVELVDKVYLPILIEKISKKFLSKNPNLTPEQISFYLNAYNDNYNIIPINNKGIDTMSFIDLEHLIDGLDINQTSKTNNKNQYDNIDLRYDENNLKIFAPKTKDQCIKLRNGRPWCTSREGSGNMYYNYRLGNGRTLYYVIDEDKDFNDLNFATVILVDRNGGKSMADKSNSGRYAGSINLPWSEIVSKVPKLEGLEDIFKSEPLTDYELHLIDIVRNTNVGDNPMNSFSSPQEVEMWLEYKTPELSDIQYKNLPVELKKKYISLGMSLTTNMISSSEPEVLKYYVNRKIDYIRNNSLSSLKDSDITLLNLPMMKKIKEEIRPKLFLSLTDTKEKKLKITSLETGDAGKLIRLYGLDSIFYSLPKDLESIEIYNPDNNGVILDIPKEIGEFKLLENLFFENCINSLPNEICELNNLRFLSVTKNSELRTIPECVINIPTLLFINAAGSNNLVMPKSIQERGTLYGDNLWDIE